MKPKLKRQTPNWKPACLADIAVWPAFLDKRNITRKKKTTNINSISLKVSDYLYLSTWSTYPYYLLPILVLITSYCNKKAAGGLGYPYPWHYLYWPFKLLKIALCFSSGVFHYQEVSLLWNCYATNRKTFPNN
jgi:hypothetical protein